MAAPINPSDLNQIEGVYPSKAIFTDKIVPGETLAVPGNEGLVQVVESADEKQVPTGSWALMKNTSFGTWRTMAMANTDQLLLVERDRIPPIEYATIMVNPSSAYRMLHDYVKLNAGDYVIQNGANSAVGKAVIQICRIRGWKSINIIRSHETRNEERRQELLDLGADIVVTDDQLASDRELSKSLPLAKLGLNCVGGRAVQMLAKILAENAQLVSYGGMSRNPVMIPTGLFIFKNISAHGFWMTHWSKSHTVEERRVMIEELVGWIAAGKLKQSGLATIKFSDPNLLESIKKSIEASNAKTVLVQ